LPGEEREPTAYLKECITALTNYLVDEVADRDLMGGKNSKHLECTG